jgi:hypothetical protein
MNKDEKQFLPLLLLLLAFFCFMSFEAGKAKGWVEGWRDCQKYCVNLP